VTPWVVSEPLAREFYRGRRVLVVGADGFLGTNCVRALEALGARLTLLVRSPRPHTNPHARVIRGDARDPVVVRAAVEDQTVVFDLAGSSGGIDSNRDPLGDLDRECVPQLNLISLCAQLRAPPFFVFCSTRTVYGQPQYLPVDEAHPLAPLSVYAVHKLAVESYLSLFNRRAGLSFCVFRLSNPYGPHQPENWRSYGVINHFIRQAAIGEAIRLYGEGEQLRDYIYVDDAVSAFVLSPALSSCRDQILNLGGRHPISVRTAAERITSIAGGPPVEFEPWPEEYVAVESGDYVTDLRKLDGCMDRPAEPSFDDAVAWTIEECRALAERAGPLRR